MSRHKQADQGVIVTIWRQGSGQPPEGTAAGVIEVQECSACGDRRVIWATDTSGLDPWKNHYDYCEPRGGGDDWD
jgi:hypothetical protein